MGRAARNLSRTFTCHCPLQSIGAIWCIGGHDKYRVYPIYFELTESLCGRNGHGLITRRRLL